jgi:1-acyl-sn-glycerol-3-phosphate acyltransferase
MARDDKAGVPPLQQRDHWALTKLILPWARKLIAYHHTVLEGAPQPKGACLYVSLHGASYFVPDLCMACYLLAWQHWHATGEEQERIRIVGGLSEIEKWLPGLPRAKEIAGIIGTGEDACEAVLARGEQLLVTPGGSREAQPSKDFYRLRWEGRYGFVRLALKTGAPIVPLAIVGGAEAYPGVRLGKLSFWSPVPMPVKIRVVLGEPIQVEKRPESARDMKVVKPIQELAWQRTQALYDRVRGEM